MFYMWKVVMCKFHSVFLSADGRIFTCGHGRGGRLGHGNEETLLVIWTTSTCTSVPWSPDCQWNPDFSNPKFLKPPTLISQTNFRFPCSGSVLSWLGSMFYAHYQTLLLIYKNTNLRQNKSWTRIKLNHNRYPTLYWFFPWFIEPLDFSKHFLFPLKVQKTGFYCVRE